MRYDSIIDQYFVFVDGGVTAEGFLITEFFLLVLVNSQKRVPQKPEWRIRQKR